MYLGGLAKPSKRSSEWLLDMNKFKAANDLTDLSGNTTTANIVINGSAANDDKGRARAILLTNGWIYNNNTYGLLTDSNSYTFYCIYKLPAITTRDSYIFAGRNATTQFIRCFVRHSDQKLVLQVGYLVGETATIQSYTATLNLNVWQNIVVSWDAVNKVIKMYINNEEATLTGITLDGIGSGINTRRLLGTSLVNGGINACENTTFKYYNLCNKYHTNSERAKNYNYYRSH
jgi:hypothetical protein